MLVGTLNFSVVSTFGSDCGLTDMEAKILIPSVQRMMERLPAATATKAALILDPLIILTVFFMWGRRIITVKNAEARQKYAVEPFEQMRANGVTGTTFGPNVPVGASPGASANGVPSESVSHSPATHYQGTSAARTATNGGYRGPTATVSDINTAARDRSGIPDDGITDPNTYHIPDAVRSAFDDNV